MRWFYNFRLGTKLLARFMPLAAMDDAGAYLKSLFAMEWGKQFITITTVGADYKEVTP